MNKNKKLQKKKTKEIDNFFSCQKRGSRQEKVPLTPDLRGEKIQNFKGEQAADPFIGELNGEPQAAIIIPVGPRFILSVSSFL